MRGYKREYPPLTAEQKGLINNYLGTDDFSITADYSKVKRAIRATIKRKLSPEEMEEYIGIADLALMKAAACFNPNKRMSFVSFANLNICSAVKTELTRQNRDCRQADKQAKSLEAPIGSNEDIRIMDTLSCDGEITIQETQRIQQYIATSICISCWTLTHYRQRYTPCQTILFPNTDLHSNPCIRL